MAEHAAQRASQGVIRTLADSILKSPGAEIDTLKTLLAQRKAQPLP